MGMACKFTADRIQFRIQSHLCCWEKDNALHKSTERYSPERFLSAHIKAVLHHALLSLFYKQRSLRGNSKTGVHDAARCAPLLSYKSDRSTLGIGTLRLEIDMFLSYVRETHARGDSYLVEKLLSGQELEKKIRDHINLWHGVPWPHLDNVIPNNYSLITKTLGNQFSIESASFDQIVDALNVCHAFHELLRFFRGGTPSVRKAFMTDNSEVKVKSSLIHLLFGSNDFISRMGQCIFDPTYSLHHFGRSCVQELCGWLNNETPVCNGRTVKSLRYLGFDVVIFG